MTTFPPGPWTVEYDDDAYSVLAPGNHLIAAWLSEPTARAIAAVPELVGAGSALLDAAERHIFGDECKAERDAFRAALAKARGPQ